MKTSEKIYREDSYLTSLEAEVVSCIKKDEQYEIVLDKTIFYPHMSGGQPKDKGTINGIKVIDVQEIEDEIIHVVKEPLSGKVSLAIDFETRFDYMQQHTGQHILSYAIMKLFDGNTVGFHLSSDYTTIDIDKVLTEDMILETEKLSNKVIYENKRVLAKEYTYEQTKDLNLRKAPPKLDNLRIVTIEDHESTACGGTHINNTGEVGIIKVTKTEKYKTGTRLWFLCGKRAVDDYTFKNKALSDLSLLFSCGSDNLSDNITKLMDENKTLKAKINLLNSDLNDKEAQELINQAVIKNEKKFILRKVNKDIKDLRYICSKITQEDNYLVLLVSEIDNFCHLVVAQSKNLEFNIKDLFEKSKNIINLKGGGNNYLLQGSGTILKADECIRLAEETMDKGKI